MDSRFSKLIAAAKVAVYNKERARIYLPLLDTRAGTVHAVLNTVAALEKKTKMPVQVMSMLAVNVYLMMVDVAMAATGKKPKKEVLQQTINAILEQLGSLKGGGGPAKQQPQGLLSGAK